MPEYMQAQTDCDQGRAGTISGLHCARRLLHKMPGQEDGNVDYVVEHEAGIWGTDPQIVAATLQRWLDNPEEMQRYAAASAAQGRPDSSQIIARTAMGLLGRYPLDQIRYYG